MQFLANGSDPTKLVMWLYERIINIGYYVYTKNEKKERKIKICIYLYEL